MFVWQFEVNSFTEDEQGKTVINEMLQNLIWKNQPVFCCSFAEYDSTAAFLSLGDH